jgi:histone deacetylase 8
MYLDLDVHFSDAVSHAFYSPNSTTSPQVLVCAIFLLFVLSATKPPNSQTLSIHHSAPGFFPISPLSSLPEPDNPAFDPLTLSIPLQEGASNPTFARIWPLVEGIKNAFEPDFIVLQCGVDGLAGDPCGRWNWALGGGEGSMGWCVDKVTREWTGGKVLLGGGATPLDHVLELVGP